jgi:hypothetical protein
MSESRKTPFENIIKIVKEKSLALYQAEWAVLNCIDEYKNVTSKINIKCKKHNKIFIKNIHDILYKKTLGGCEKCTGININETLVGWALNNLGFSTIKQEELKVSKFFIKTDYFVPELNCYIEYNGLQHYEPKKFSKKVSDKEVLKKFKYQQKRDQALRDYCQRYKIGLIEIDGREIKGYDAIYNFLTAHPLIKGYRGTTPSSNSVIKQLPQSSDIGK